MSEATEMTCQELVEVITDYLEGSLNATDSKRFETHLSGCSDCRAYLEQMRVTITLTGGLRSDSMPDRVREQLLAAFREWKRG